VPVGWRFTKPTSSGWMRTTTRSMSGIGKPSEPGARRGLASYSPRSGGAADIHDASGASGASPNVPSARTISRPPAVIAALTVAYDLPRFTTCVAISTSDGAAGERNVIASAIGSRRPDAARIA